MKLPIIVGSNMYNERDQVEGWLKNVRGFADGVFIVDNGSTDGTIEYFRKEGIHVIESNIIIEEGYGPARNHLRKTALELYPNAHWLLFMDADERIDEGDYHAMHFLADTLQEKYNCVAFPRIDWHDLEKTKAENDYKVSPDWQCRMTRLNSSVMYVRRLHEQVVNHVMYETPLNPVLNHFHRCASKEKRDQVGRVCSYLHNTDTEYGHTYPKHHKEEFYAEQRKEKGIK